MDPKMLFPPKARDLRFDNLSNHVGTTSVKAFSDKDYLQELTCAEPHRNPTHKVVSREG
jgi:hypothetical protein